MAHTIRKVNIGNTAIAQVTFTSYTSGVGGEAFTLAEFGLTGSLVNVFFIGMVDAGIGRIPLLARYVGGGKVQLVNSLFPDQEMATAASLSYTVFVVVQGS